MESNSICKICNQGFVNRKALGGHMRAHLAKLPLGSKSFIHKQPNHSLDQSLSSSSSLKEELNEIESGEPISSSLRRMKRRCRRAFEATVALPEQISSSYVLDSNSVYEAATTLMMIAEGITNHRKRKFDYNIDFDDVSSGFEDEEEDESYINRVGSKVTKSCYRCDLCNKVFRSPQALGGHKRSHKRVFEKVQFDEKEGSRSSNKNQRKFKCSFCSKEFDSGQALGGHRRVHLANLVPQQGRTNTIDINVSEQYPFLSPFSPNDHAANNAQSERELLDLNLPVPELLEQYADLV